MAAPAKTRGTAQPGFTSPFVEIERDSRLTAPQTRAMTAEVKRNAWIVSDFRLHRASRCIGTDIRSTNAQYVPIPPSPIFGVALSTRE
jgi:hypothetical protein